MLSATSNRVRYQASLMSRCNSIFHLYHPKWKLTACGAKSLDIWIIHADFAERISDRVCKRCSSVIREEKSRESEWPCEHSVGREASDILYRPGSAIV
jgi:hypothetical protein